MLAIIWAILFMLVGVFLITKSSDWMTDSLVPVAKKLGTSYIAVASILVSVMLSIPEIFVAFYSFFMGHEGIAIGVIIGSVACNIALMTGLSAMIRPLSVDGRVVIRDGMFALVAAVIVFIFGLDLNYSRSEGAVLLILFIPYVLNVMFFEKWREEKIRKKELKTIEEELKVMGGPAIWKLKPGLPLFILSSGILLYGSYLFSDSLIKLARITGISEVIIGLTVGAIGPSIPNIASAIQGTVKDYTKVAITETFGSDIFTLLVTLGLLAVIAPFGIDKKWLIFDIPAVIIMTALMLFFIFKGSLKGKDAILRYEGVLLVIAYLVFLAINLLFQ